MDQLRIGRVVTAALVGALMVAGSLVTAVRQIDEDHRVDATAASGSELFSQLASGARGLLAVGLRVPDDVGVPGVWRREGERWRDLGFPATSAPAARPRRPPGRLVAVGSDDAGPAVWTG